jgi:hypothetical protein
MSINVARGEDTYLIDAEASDSIENIKTYIFNAINVPVAKQRLEFNGDVLENGLTLSDYGITAGDTLDLFVCTYDQSNCYPGTCNNNAVKTYSLTSENGYIPPFSLKDMIGTSSAAYAAVIYSSLSMFSPSYKIWNASSSSELIPDSGKVLVSDGAFADNTAVVSLLARGVKRIVSFLHNGEIQPFPDQNPLGWLDIASLFGTVTSDMTTLYPYYSGNTLQVFESDKYDEFKQQLIDRNTNGGPSFSRMRLKVLPNYNYGVAGGYDVEILMFYLLPSTEFNQLLPQEIQDEIALGASGRLSGFPLFATLLQDGLNVCEYTMAQINLLSTYTEWCIRHPSAWPHVLDMYGLDPNTPSGYDELVHG